MASLATISLLYTLLAWFVCRKQSDKILFENGTVGIITYWNAKHLAGTLLLFVAPLLFIKPPPVALSAGIYKAHSIILILGVGYFLLNLSIINGFNLPVPLKRKNLLPDFKTGKVILLRLIFLIAHEFFFRGVLLFSVVYVQEELAAIFIATAFYTFSHIGSARKEIIATIPFGIFLCWITLETRSLIPAVILHWVIALPAELIAIKKVVQSQKNVCV